MRLFFIIGCLVLGAWGREEKELIMLEIQSEPSERSMSKRQTSQYESAGQQPQYVIRSQAQEQQVPAEYLSLLQQLQAQQGVSSQQVNPNDIQQLLISRNPQGYAPQPARRPPSPQQQHQQRLQLGVAQKAIREQELNDAQRQQLRQYYQQQNLALSAAATAAYQLQPQPQPAQPAPQHAAPQQYYTTQLVSPQPVQARPQYYRLEPQEPERVSYAQVQFGGEPRPTAQPQPRPKPQPILYQPQPQQVIYQVPRAQSTTEAPKQSSTPPQQYLIETTKPEQQEERVLARPQYVYYRPQPNYQDIQRQLLVAQQQQYLQQEREEPRAPAPTAPSRSAIYVSKSTSTPEPRQPQYIQVPVPQISLPGSHQGRPLTGTELKALENAGFQVPGATYDSQDYLSPYSISPQRTYYRGVATKRQSKRVPKPVELTKDERQALEQQGIRNLYRIETAETKEAPVTYVLALGKPKSS